ncbi:MAG: hypothetical protein ACPKQO_10670 [Nitrososphaeraceae archaeon]
MEEEKKKKVSNPSKIGLAVFLVGIIIVATGTLQKDETFAYYGMILVMIGLFIYIAYSFSFGGKNKINYKEKRKKR